MQTKLLVIFSSLPHPVLPFPLWVSHQPSLPLYLLPLHSFSFSFSLSPAFSLSSSLFLLLFLSLSLRQMPLPSRSQLSLLVREFQMFSRDELG